MAPVLTATPSPDQYRIMVEVQDDVADLDPATSVERDDGLGYKPRRFATILDTARHKVWADYEVPTDRTVKYRETVTQQVVSVSLPSGGATWWKPLPYPGLSMAVDVLSYLEDGTSETETVDLWPLGADYPVTVYGVRRAYAGTVTVATFTKADGTRFQDGLRRSPVVLLQPPGGADQVYLSVTQVQRRLHRRLAEPAIVWTMAAQVRAAPVVEWSYPGTATWASYDTESTWNGWVAGGSWLDVLVGV